MKKIMGLVFVCMIFMLVSCKNTDKNVEMIYDEKFANSGGVYVTEKYWYRVDSFDVTRYNKTTYSTEKLSDAISVAVGVTKDTLYYANYDETGIYTLYSIGDEESTPQTLYRLSADERYFIDGKYIYSVSKNGSVTRRINSGDQYEKSAEIIYEGKQDDVCEIKFYNGYIYYLINDGKALMRISLDGNEKEILNGVSNKKYYFCQERIIFTDNDKNLCGVKLDGSDLKIYPDIQLDHYYFVADGRVYANDNEGAYRFDVNATDSNQYETVSSMYWAYCDQFSDVGDGIIYFISGKLYLFDYTGNKVSDIY